MRIYISVVDENVYWAPDKLYKLLEVNLSVHISVHSLYQLVYKLVLHLGLQG